MKLLLLPLLFAAAALLLNSCGTSTGGGSGQTSQYASVLVGSQDETVVRRAAYIVFTEAGFDSESYGSAVMRFRKRADRATETKWQTGDTPNPVWIRPEVELHRSRDGIRVNCTAYVIQIDSTTGEKTREPLLSGKAGYQHMLGEIKHRVETGGQTARTSTPSST